MIGTSTLSDLARRRHRISGTDTDTLDQVCPALSPDGRRVAYGQAEGNGEEADVTGSGTEIRHDATYRHAALVIVDLDAHVNATPSRPTSRLMNAATSVCRLTEPSGPWPDSRASGSKAPGLRKP